MGGKVLELESERLFKKVREETTIESLKKLMKNLKCSVDRAMDILEIPSGQRDTYKKLLNI